MIKLVKEIFNNTLTKNDMRYIGDKAYVMLPNNKRIEISLNSNSVNFKLFHTTNGIIHFQEVSFSDVFDSMNENVPPNKLYKHIFWDEEKEKYCWFGKPSNEDIAKLNKCLSDYIEICS